MNQDDLRVQRTHRLLREALIDLMDEGDYEQITIREITQRAQVGYKTFFRHYEGKQALFLAIVEESLVAFQGVLLPATAAQAPERNTLTAVQFAAKNATLMKAVFRSPFADELLAPLVAVGLQEGRAAFSGTGLSDDLVAYHFVSTMISLLKWWLDHDQPCSAEELAEAINQLLIRPLENLQKGTVA
ncbi:MAG: TetR/AcrR family transcriptional regulator [Anaerolineales bacterium]|nr:TetR/AcrR family transcriptional regulator [Anaerolineales bacterium]